MNLEFVRQPFYIAFQVVFGLLMIGWGVIGWEYASQWDKCNLAINDLDAKTQARLTALQARVDKDQAREASLKARDPELANKLNELQKSPN